MKAKLLAIWTAIKTDLVDTYKRLKIVIFAIAAAIIYLEFNKIKEALTVYGAKKEMAADNKKDVMLASTEKADSDQADALVKAANDLPKQEAPVQADWYKKDPK
jgi:hypothetical protein